MAEHPPAESPQNHDPTEARLALEAAEGPTAGSGRGGYPGGYEASDSEGVHLVDFLMVVYKRRWIAVTTFIIVFVSVAVYTFTAVPLYEANTRLLIEKENANVVNF